MDDIKFIDYFKNKIPETLDEFVDISIQNSLGGPKTLNWWKADKVIVWETIYTRIKGQIKITNN